MINVNSYKEAGRPLYSVYEHGKRTTLASLAAVGTMFLAGVSIAAEAVSMINIDDDEHGEDLLVINE